MKKLISFILLIAAIANCNAQSLSPKVLPANGGSAVSGGASLSFTFGETFNATLTSGGAMLTQGEQQPELDLYTGVASASSLCAGNSFTLPFTATGYFASGNIFTAQLSNAAGSFTSPVNIGSLAGTTSGTINCTIPLSTIAGSNYLVRVKSSTPIYTGKVSSTILSISTAPPPGTIHFTSAPAFGCVGVPDIISANTVSGATFYRWSCSQAGVLFNGNPSPYQSLSPNVNISYTSLPQAGASGWSICVFAGNACGNTNEVCSWIRATVASAGAINGSLIGCPGSSGNNYSISAIAGAASYQWTGSPGISITGNGGQSVSLSFATTFVSGTLSVHGQTSCGYNGPDKTITISRSPAVPGTISGTSYPCPNTTATFSIAAVTGATSYTWTTSVPGAIITGTTTSCSISFPASIPAGSLVSVSANSSCAFSSTVRSKGIASGLPNIPGNISGPANGQCGETGVSYSIAPVANATGYNWSSTCGTIQGPTNLSGITMDWSSSMTSCSISVSSVNSCGSSVSRTMMVTGAPNTPTTIAGSQAVCSGAVEQYCAFGSNGASSYQWTLPAGAIIIGPANGVCILVQWGASGGTLICKAINGCGVSGNKTMSVAVTCRQSQATHEGATLDASVFPNPAIEHATLKFHSPAASHYRVNIYDVIGKNIYSTDVDAIQGLNVLELNVASMAKGVYMLRISNADTEEKLNLVLN